MRIESEELLYDLESLGLEVTEGDIPTEYFTSPNGVWAEKLGDYVFDSIQLIEEGLFGNYVVNDNYPDRSKPEYLKNIVDLQMAKRAQIIKIKNSAAQEVVNMSSGCTTNVLDGGGNKIVVDCRRHDFDNFKSTLDYLEKKNIASTYIRDFYNDLHEITVAELSTICDNIYELGVGIYQRKWALEQQVFVAGSISDVTAITF